MTLNGERWLNERRGDRECKIFLTILIVAGCMGVGFEVYGFIRMAAPAATETKVLHVHSAQDLKLDQWGTSPSRIDWPEGEKVLDGALKSWAKATGISIVRPTLWVGGCLGSETLACANRGENRITLGAAFMSPDRTASTLSIMLHEVGHLYGVPHIEGDKLMDATASSGSAEEPTAAAVAVAKIQQTEIHP